MLVLFAGFSGVGKDTVMKRVIGEFPDEFAKFPSYTTRAPRDGESEGNPYCFISTEEFLKKLEDGEIYEYNFIHGKAYYGGSKRILSQYIATGKTLFKDIDVEGVRTYKNTLSSITRIVSIYLYCADEETVIARLRGRGDSEESIAIRRQRFALENELSCESDYMLNNIDLEVTAAIAKRICDAEKASEVYLPAVMPTESEIAAANGDTAPVILEYNGSDLIVTQGADRYISALRNGSFIQKKIESFEINTALKAACTATEMETLLEH